MTASEKVAYLKGLMEGMELNRDSGEGKLLSVIADILGDMAEDIEDLESDLYDLSEDVDTISDDLSDVEDLLREDEDWDGLEDEEDEEPQFYEITCQSCGPLGRAQCPNCGSMMDFEFDDVDAGDEEE